MDVQNIIVYLIVLAAVIYAGKSVWGKVKSFSVKSGCGNNCGCGDSKSSVKNSVVNIQKL
jgi:hypothetical protein